MSAKRKVIAVAMSGGVDSSLAMALLRQAGRHTIGLTARLGLETSEREEDAIRSARAVAASLGAEHHTFDLRDQFKREVVDYFVDSYLTGATPNPCIVCNRQIKFGHLLQMAREVGADQIATGHYAKIKRLELPFIVGSFISRATDRAKDQSYFLLEIPHERVGSIVFPLGDLTKAETRDRARALRLASSDRKESQDVCFLEGADYVSFIERLAPRSGKIGRGAILDESGAKVGEHAGFHRYTIGQRRALNHSDHRGRRYVSSIDSARNEVRIGAESALYSKSVELRGFNCAIDPTELGRLRLFAQPRHRAKALKVSIEPISSSNVRVKFDEPARAIARGQGMAIYHDDDILVGGGWIERADRID